MDDMGDDGGADTGGDMVDPTLMEGVDGGEDVMMGMEGMSSGNGNSLANLKVQTLLALQELGIVIGVAFMVGTIFMLMIFVEKVCNGVSEVYQKKFGTTEDDPEDPAALVGTFKRYKN